MGIHQSPQVLADPLLAEELFEKLGAVFQVVTTDPPLPRFPMLDPGGIVTSAPLHSTWAARFGKCMGQCCRGHSQQECSLLESCGRGIRGGGRKEKIFKATFFQGFGCKSYWCSETFALKEQIYDKMLFASPINLLSQNVYRGLDALSGFTTTSAILQVFLRRNSSPDISFWFCTVICFTQSHHHGIFWSN